MASRSAQTLLAQEGLGWQGAAGGAIMNSTPERDLALIERIRGGDTAAFDELICPYRSMLRSHIGRVVGDPADSEDVLQETLIRAYRGLKGFRGDSCFYTWVYRIALNCAFAFLARRARASTDIRDAATSIYHDGWEASVCECPEEIISGKQMAAIVDATLATMHPECRAAILQREFDGFSYSEIADNMRCPIGTVRSRISRARQVIASKLGRRGFAADFG
jgi:RNA polymerase sigma-70 factor (ECF subfamily)